MLSGLAEVGPHCIYKHRTSVPLVRIKRGGARNSGSRQSWELHETDCRKVIGASRAARQIGMPLNRFITIAWERGGVPADQAVEATGKFIRMAREWMRVRDCPMPWVWVQEGSNRFGQHVHLMLYVPSHLAPMFRSMPLRWTKIIIPGVYVSGVLQTQRLRFSEAANGPAYEAEMLGKIHYILKCAPIELEWVVGMAGHGRKPWGQYSSVTGKRAGVWQGWKSAAVMARAVNS